MHSIVAIFYVHGRTVQPCGREQARVHVHGRTVQPCGWEQARRYLIGGWPEMTCPAKVRFLAVIDVATTTPLAGYGD